MFIMTLLNQFNHLRIFTQFCFQGKYRNIHMCQSYSEELLMFQKLSHFAMKIEIIVSLNKYIPQQIKKHFQKI